MSDEQWPVVAAEERAEWARTESTSAALRRVEQERDDARDTAALRQGQLTAARHHANEAQRQRDAARAELASARTELDAVRTARDNLDRELAEARTAEPGGDVLYRQARYACEQCGSRYGIAYTDHPCGPLTPVTVTITRRTEEPS